MAIQYIIEKTDLYKKIEKIGFINGVYTPWFDNKYSKDIGTSVLTDYKECCFNANRVKEAFFNCKAIGFDMTLA